MGCNCKKDENGVKIKEPTSIKNEPLVIRGIITVVKVFLYVIASTIGVVIVIPFTFYMLFKIIFLNEGIDASGLLLSLGKLTKKKEIEETDEDDEDYEEDDYDDDEEEFKFKDEDEIVLLDTK